MTFQACLNNKCNNLTKSITCICDCCHQLLITLPVLEKYKGDTFIVPHPSFETVVIAVCFGLYSFDRRECKVPMSNSIKQLHILINLPEAYIDDTYRENCFEILYDDNINALPIEKEYKALIRDVIRESMPHNLIDLR